MPDAVMTAGVPFRDEQPDILFGEERQSVRPGIDRFTQNLIRIPQKMRDQRISRRTIERTEWHFQQQSLAVPFGENLTERRIDLRPADTHRRQDRAATPLATTVSGATISFITWDSPSAPRMKQTMR